MLLLDFYGNIFVDFTGKTKMMVFLQMNHSSSNLRTMIFVNKQACYFEKITDRWKSAQQLSWSTALTTDSYF